MDNIKIQTTQNVDIEYQLASVGERILATLLDYVFFAAYFFVVILLLSWAELVGRNYIAVMIILALPVLLYDLLCEMFLQGKTFGKMIMKIKVVKLDGSQASFGAYALRWLLRIIDTKIFSGGIALIVIVINGKGQRIGDMAAGTTVIKIRQKVTLNDTILNKVKPEYTIVFPQISQLTDNDISVIKEVMRVALRTNNQEAIEQLAAKTKATMGITTNLPHTQFLATVVQDYSQYSFDN